MLNLSPRHWFIFQFSQKLHSLRSIDLIFFLSMSNTIIIKTGYELDKLTVRNNLS